MNHPIRVLYVDDSPLDRALVRDALEQEHGGFQVMEATSRADFEARMVEGGFDLVLSDFNILGFEGVQVVESVHAKYPQMPVLIVTGTGSEEIAVRAMKSGAADYVIKSPAHIRRLPYAIRSALEKKRVERERDRFFRLSLDLFCIAGFDGYFKQLNPAWERTLGWTNAELMSKPYLEFVHPDDRTATGVAKAALGAGRHVYMFHNRYRCKDGSYRWLSWNSYPVVEEKLVFAVARDVTERRRADEQLLHDQSILENAQERAHLGSWELDLSTMSGTWSKEMYRLHGLQPAEKPPSFEEFLEFVHPEDRDRFHRRQSSIAQTGETSDFEYRTNPDRCPFRIISVALHLVKNAEGQAVLLAGSNLDITDRKLAELASKEAEVTLRASEAKFRALTETAAAAIFIYQEDKFHYVNLIAETLTGYTREELLKKRFWEIVHPDFQNLIRERAAARQRGEPVPSRYEFKIVRKGGDERWVDFTAGTIEYEGHLAGLGTAYDITDRKLAEEQLQLAQEQYKSFFEEDLAGAYISTASGRLITCNPAFLRIFRLASLEEALDADVNSFYLHRKDRDEFLARLHREKKLEYVEHQMARRDGATLHVVENVIGRFDEQGNLTQIQGYVFDDTKRRELEQQLIQAQKLESLGTLASGIAHDFNNILAIILGHSSRLARHQDDPTMLSQSLDAIQKATQRGASLVRQLLTFARKTESVFESVSINDIIREIMKLLGETLPKTIIVSTNLKADLPRVVADATQIHQVLLNLCLNARDAMQRSGTLGITTTTISGEAVSSKFPRAVAREYVFLQVSDTGAGMDAATRQRIFEPFFTTKGPGKGTGLGLALVYSIIESHGGFIDVESELGKGATFSLYLPIPERGVPEDQEKAQVDQDVPGGVETILLIEDEEMLRELLKEMLVIKGYTVMMARDGEEGVHTFSRHKKEIAVVVSDLGLPKLGGEEVYKRIRALDPAAKIILASGFIDPSVKSELQKVGARHFVQKPYSANEVLLAIRDILKA